jgi:molybdenum cofactor biosynthesis protein B
MTHTPDRALPVNIAILTVSDSRTHETDTSGRLLAERALAAGHHVVEHRIIPDDSQAIRITVLEWVQQDGVDVILTTGGTGVTNRDVTVDVIEKLYRKAIPGFGELFRMLSFREIGSSTVQSRASAGIVESTFAFVLPGSTGACRLAWDEILANQLDSTHKPCNFVELLPRIRG